MSEPEVMLWSQLRGRGPDKPTFRRQHPFGSYILDFSGDRHIPSGGPVARLRWRPHRE
jgi:very-short-patch-repair endonuclease